MPWVTSRTALLCMLCVFSACDGRGDKAKARDREPAVAAAPRVAVPNAESTLKPPEPDTSAELAGDLRPEYSADLAFKIGGQLVAVRAVRGDHVKKGQLMAVLADDEARAQLAAADAAVLQAEAQLALANDNQARAAALVAANAAPSSQSTAVRLQREIANAALLQAQASRSLANATLSNHQLKAPFDGAVVKVPDGLGQIVAPGTPLFRLEALDRLLFRTTVAEADVERIHVGDEVTIEASGGRKVIGVVRLVLRSVEATSRRVPIEVSVLNDDGKLIAGSYVRAKYKAH